MRPTLSVAALILFSSVLALAQARADGPSQGQTPAARTPSLHLVCVGDPGKTSRADPAPAPSSTPSAPSSGSDSSPSPGLTGAIAALEAPNGPVLGRDLSKIDEDNLLLPGDRAALRAVGDSPDDFHPDREPLILIHGIEGDPKDVQTVATRLVNAPFQQYVVCYDDFHRRTSENGFDLAQEIRRLSRTLGPKRDFTFVAHSMGGIVVRGALNELAFGPDRGIEKLGRVRFIAVDTPWHGYPGPSDTGVQGAFMDIARVFLPAGLDDMRARSAMFQGDPGASDPAERRGLLDPILPDNVEIELDFAKEGNVVLNYSKGKLRDLAPKVADWYVHETPVTGDPMLVNEWKALLSGNQYYAFQDEMRAIADPQGRLDGPTVEVGLERHFPLFPGDHVGILQEHPGEHSLLDHLTEELGGGTPSH
jgi:hypothetical protein